jgi:hypothetical protein
MGSPGHCGYCNQKSDNENKYTSFAGLFDDHTGMSMCSVHSPMEEVQNFARSSAQERRRTRALLLEPLGTAIGQVFAPYRISPRCWLPTIVIAHIRGREGFVIKCVC